MRERLKYLLEKSPLVYHFAERIYYTLKFRRLMVLLFGTRVWERYYALHHPLPPIREWPSEALEHPHRHFLVERIAAFSPFSSVCEVGCSWGVNLYLVAEKFPSAQVRGIDINPSAIQRGAEWFGQEGMPDVTLSVGKADKLGEFEDRSFDIVFTDALLIYIGPDKITEVIKELIRITRRALILLELHSFQSQGKAKDALGAHYHDFWKRDYVALLKKFLPEEQIHVTKLPEEVWPVGGWKELGAVIEVIL